MAQSSVARLYRFKGSNLFKEGKYEEAVEAFTKAISIEPDEIAGPSNRCAALMKLERWEEVIMDASTCLQLDPTHARSVARKARALFEMGEYTEAIANAERAMEMEPEFREPMEDLKASCTAAMGDSKGPAPAAEAKAPLNDAKPSSSTSTLPAKAAVAVEAVLAAPATAEVAPPLDPTPTAPTPLPPASPPLADVPLPSPEPSFASVASTSPPAPLPAEPDVGGEVLEDERLPEAAALEAKIVEMQPMFGRNTKKAVDAWTEALTEFPGQATWHLARGCARLVLGEREPAIADLTAALGLIHPKEEVSNVACMALERRAQARALLGDLQGAARDAGEAVKRAPTAEARTSAQNDMTRYLAQMEEQKAAAAAKPPAAVVNALALGEAAAAEGVKYLVKLKKRETAYEVAARVRNEGRRRRNAARCIDGPPPSVPTTEVVALGDGVELLLTRLPVVIVGKGEEKKKEKEVAPAASAVLPQVAPVETDGGFKASYDQGVRALRSKSWQEAETAFSAAAAAATADRLPWCLVKRAVARLGAGYPEEALEDLEKAQKSASEAAEDPQLWLELWQTRAKALESLGRLDTAVEELEEAEVQLKDMIRPEQTNGLLRKVMELLDKKGKVKAAAERRPATQRSAARAATAAVESPQRPWIEEIGPGSVVEPPAAAAAAAAGGSSPEDLAAKAEAARVHLDTATRELAAGNIDAAKTGFALAAMLDPTLIDPHGKLALLEGLCGNWAKAEAHCCAAMAAPGGEDDPHIRELRARAYAEQGRRVEAFTDYGILSSRFGDADAGKKVEELRKALVGSGELSAEAAAQLVEANGRVSKEENGARVGSSDLPLAALLDPSFDLKTFDELESIDFAKVGPRVR